MIGKLYSFKDEIMKTILIVDDEAQIRDIICKYAVFSGYDAEQAENGMRAVEMCRAKAYDLIIMDIIESPKIIIG